MDCTIAPMAYIRRYCESRRINAIELLFLANYKLIAHTNPSSTRQHILQHLVQHRASIIESTILAYAMSSSYWSTRASEVMQRLECLEKLQALDEVILRLEKKEQEYYEWQLKERHLWHRYHDERLVSFFGRLPRVVPYRSTLLKLLPAPV